eukprot:6517119-Karenia_brevis.AAC.1
MHGMGKWGGSGLSPFGILSMLPWARVKGPMGATQMHLIEMGWEVRWSQGQLRLKDYQGDVWQPNPQYGAAEHRHGRGVEDGLDLTLTTKHHNWYIKQGKLSQAGAIMA